MGDYLALAWRAENLLARTRVAQLKRRATAAGAYRVVADEAQFLLLVCACLAPPVRRIGRDGWVVGDLFGRAGFEPAPDVLKVCEAGGGAQARRLIARYWGRYVALWPDGDTLSALRDPSGAVEALRWRIDGVTLVASDLPPADLLGPLAWRAEICWPVVAGFLSSSSGAAAAELGLSGVEAALPGARLGSRSVTAGGELLWTPAACARAEASDPAVLVAAVDGAARAFAAGDPGVIAEISGGLDSAIVASALRRGPALEVKAWTNFYARDPEADERDFARAVAQRLGVGLTEILKPDQTLTCEALEGMPTGLRPSVNGLDRQYDADVVRLAREHGACRVLTGQGGDAVFFQRVTALAAADLRGRGLGAAQWAGVLAAMARSTRRSVWSVGREALWGRLAGVRPKPAVAPFVSADARRLARRLGPHPWLARGQAVAPAKALQIEALIYASGAYGASERGRRIDLVHPLLSQPVIEACLAIPVADLTWGGRVMGICGGYQILGARIADPEGVEGPSGSAAGLGLLDIETVLAGDKVLRPVSGELHGGAAFRGYEMHIGRTHGQGLTRPMLTFADGSQGGAVSPDGRISGCYVHGLFADRSARAAILAGLGAAARAGDHAVAVDTALDEIAAELEGALDIARLARLAGLPA
ncbi:asparagine synthase-related protein [Phenylobacterium sp. CCH9-H3]|uniref:asparagine synthase-related protein n=1 Tax=Phenylobacterium sp. CCH9-H3 TaxID=1768774 RepID=UPI00083B79AC|nr:asparagine synthase-related protein [Phenylobacterium sp. CCH9-H3]